MQTRQTLANIYCLKELTQGLDKQIICLSVINTVLAITAIVGNTVVLIALQKETSLHRPSKALLQNLIVSDFCVGFAELASVGKWLSILQEQWRICRFFFHAHSMMAIICISVSLCTLVAISVDRLLALLFCLVFCFYLSLASKTLSSDARALMLIYFNTQLMKNWLKPVNLICKYLKVDCIESDFEPEKRATKRLLNADKKRRESCCKISFFISPA